MSPKEIISKHICGIEGMRIPYARMIVENILRDLADEGYSIVDMVAVQNSEEIK